MAWLILLLKGQLSSCLSPLPAELSPKSFARHLRFSTIHFSSLIPHSQTQIPPFIQAHPSLPTAHISVLEEVPSLPTTLIPSPSTNWGWLHARLSVGDTTARTGNTSTVTELQVCPPDEAWAGALLWTLSAPHPEPCPNPQHSVFSTQMPIYVPALF